MLDSYDSDLDEDFNHSNDDSDDVNDDNYNCVDLHTTWVSSRRAGHLIRIQRIQIDLIRIVMIQISIVMIQKRIEIMTVMTILMTLMCWLLPGWQILRCYLGFALN